MTAPSVPPALKVVRLAVPLLFVAVLFVKIGGAMLFGEAPRLQIPPDGYFAEQHRILLQWTRGGHDGAFHLQVAPAGRFDASVIDVWTLKTSYTLPPLEPGTHYCWRVSDRPGADTACFRTSEAFVSY